jgi:hypothetical protein
MGGVGGTKMKTEWTDQDEKAFQELLIRRRAAAAAVLAEVNPSQHAIDTYAEATAEDYAAQEAWDDYLAWVDPADLRAEMQELKEFMGEEG